MILPEIPDNESQRQEALEEYQILDTLPGKEFDNITRIASQICQTPISLISLVDHNRQWFKSHHGVDITETPRDVAFCAHAINHPDRIFIVPDATKDERFTGNPLTTGDPSVIFYTGIPLVSPKGFALGTLCVIDEKPKSLTEEQLGSLKALANQVVNLFELHKTNLELKKMQTNLQNRNKELEQFAYVVSHDLKSPLGNIISFAELMQIEQLHRLDENGREYLEYINRSAYKLKALIDGILAYYRGDQLISYPGEDTDLHDFLHSIIELVHVPNELCTIQLPEGPAIIRINKRAMEQIFINLITNGIKYNNKKDIRIDITFDQDERYYYFTVSDNGIGIRPESLDQIFDLFKILDVRDRFGDYGTGIGLATVKKLIENQGGKITVQSTVNERTEFRFSVRKPE